MKKIFLFALFTSCAHQPIDYDKSKLVEVKKDDSHFYFLQNYEPKVQPNRTIASVSEVNNRRDFYFTTIYHQYRELSSLAKEPSELKSCPAFHQTWVDLKNKTFQRQLVLNQSYKDVLEHEYSLALYPELALKDKSGRSLARLVQKNYVEDEASLTRKVIANYNDKNLEELKTLCETGLSHNYYIFENMISFYSQNLSPNKSEIFKAYMKMPIMTNFLLMERFSTGMEPFVNNKMKEQVFIMLGASSFHRYLDNLDGLRNNFKKISYQTSRD